MSYLTVEAGLERTPQPGIQGVSQTVTHHIKSEDDYHYRQARSHGNPGMSLEEPVAIVHHGAPGRHGRLNADAQEAQTRLG